MLSSAFSSALLAELGCSWRRSPDDLGRLWRAGGSCGPRPRWMGRDRGSPVGRRLHLSCRHTITNFSGWRRHLILSQSANPALLALNTCMFFEHLRQKSFGRKWGVYSPRKAEWKSNMSLGLARNQWSKERKTAGNCTLTNWETAHKTWKLGLVPSSSKRNSPTLPSHLNVQDQFSSWQLIAKEKEENKCHERRLKRHLCL